LKFPSSLIKGLKHFSGPAKRLDTVQRGGAKMRKYLAPFIIFSSLLFLMGMGGLGGSAPADTVPVPEKNFNARALDHQGIETSLSQFSFDGKVFLVGKRGDATVTIPFEKISHLDIQGQERNEVLATVILRNQEKIEVKVNKNSKFYGKADFGTFQIESKDVKSISFQP
jgi:hypothetical protein